MKPTTIRNLLILSVALVLGSLWIVVGAGTRYARGEGGFKLGVDLVGGTILVYEVDPEKPKRQDYTADKLAAAIKRRIDPADLYNVTIRPVGESRVEIILPTGGHNQTKKEEEFWGHLL